MARIYDQEADDAFQQAHREVRQAVLETQDMVEAMCPHPDCGLTTTAPAPDVGTKITVTRSAALFGDYEKMRCPEGHKIFVHYCKTS
ncbi:hypothetical protein [Halococcus sediminicola]|uniref:hypothetical protein n=1 Tax=Halococcus sediminicola TaxID=1264579 RepID=UPI000678C2EB|nr:hypothetical protein [Halococcus sediminicola]